MTDHPLHPACMHIAWLLGTWRGPGSGHYPTIEPFEYEEQLEFWHLGKPWLGYRQRTWNRTSGMPMHGETGYWRPVGTEGIELVLAHPTGLAEIEEGSVKGSTITVSSRTIARTSTAKRVDELQRTFTLDGDVLRYEVSMAAVGVELSPHLRAELKRA